MCEGWGRENGLAADGRAAVLGETGVGLVGVQDELIQEIQGV